VLAWAFYLVVVISERSHRGLPWGADWIVHLEDGSRHAAFLMALAAGLVAAVLPFKSNYRWEEGLALLINAVTATLIGCSAYLVA
jgi:hypothetical protein